MRQGTAAALLAVVALTVVSIVPACGAEADYVPGEERRILKSDATSRCIGDPRSPACALDTLLSCLIHADRDVCNRIGTVLDAQCQPVPRVGVSYIIERIYAVDTLGAWPSSLHPLSARDRHARIIFRAGFCRKDHDCYQPDVITYGDVEKVGSEWRFAEGKYQGWQLDPYHRRQLCEAEDAARE